MVVAVRFLRQFLQLPVGFSLWLWLVGQRIGSLVQWCVHLEWRLRLTLELRWTFASRGQSFGFFNVGSVIALIAERNVIFA